MATVQVSTLDEFLTAITVSGDVVECPENAEWNWGDRAPISSTILIKCAEIDGNGTKIIGLQHNSSAAPFSLRYGTYIHDLQFVEFRSYFTDNSAIKPFMYAYYTSGTDFAKLQRVSASGIIYSNGDNDNNCFIYEFQSSWGVEIDTCAFNIRFPSGGCFWQTTSGNVMTFAENSRIEITTTSATSYGYNGYNPFVRRYNVDFTIGTDATNCDQKLNTAAIFAIAILNYAFFIITI